MGRTRRIPVVKNRVVLKEPKKRSVWGQIGVLVFAFALMLLFVWLKIQSHLRLAKIQKLELELKQNMAENEKLNAEKIRLSSFGRIHKIAEEKLGLQFLPDENIIQISKN